MTAKMVIIDDDYADKFDEFIALSNGQIEILNDKNLEVDPFFYERKASLDKTIASVDNGSMKMQDFNSSIDKLIKNLS